jgi:hypothetical protein
MYCDLINRHGSRSTVYENQSLVIFIKYVMEEIMLIRVLRIYTTCHLSLWSQCYSDTKS